jgi:chromosome segregation ATPase
MSTTAAIEKLQKTSNDEATARRVGLPSLKIVAVCLLAVALVVALGMTGGQVRELAGRVSAIESERDAFERRVGKLRQDNGRLIGRLRDYQGVLEVAQSSNISLSKLAEGQEVTIGNRDLAINDLQDSLDVILKEKYANENQLRNEIARLENLKRDLSAQVAALGEAVAAQGNEIAQLDTAYRKAEVQVAQASERNSDLLTENDRYLNMLTEMQDDLDAVQQEGEMMAERFTALQSQSELLEAEKEAIQHELEAIKSSVAPFGNDGGFSDPFGSHDPFGQDTSDQIESIRSEQEVASAEHPA